MIVAIGNVDGSIRRDDQPGRIIEARLGSLAARETALPGTCNRRDGSIRIDPAKQTFEIACARRVPTFR